ncbi:hypothetical protein SORBI_3004G233100 [Sorghum bicolor]|uniref:Uncharacterized protein n=1 Tax=Sorghum bicolor TaxID=4558 RepID=C5XYN6_SORBI|nr:hypothetical protein SORBI_3004G233100 [Sorghum bicolor]
MRIGWSAAAVRSFSPGRDKLFRNAADQLMGSAGRRSPDPDASAARIASPSWNKLMDGSDCGWACTSRLVLSCAS